MSNAKFQSSLMHIQENMLNFAYMLTSNRDDAYELLHTTTLTALENQDSLDGVNLKSRIFKLMRKLVAGRSVHAMQREQAVSYTGTLTQFTRVQSFEMPEQSYDAHYAADRLQSFDEYYREPFAMFVAGYKYKEIAKKFNTSTGDVKKRIRHAHNLLAQNV